MFAELDAGYCMTPAKLECLVLDIFKETFSAGKKRGGRGHSIVGPHLLIQVLTESQVVRILLHSKTSYSIDSNLLKLGLILCKQHFTRLMLQL